MNASRILMIDDDPFFLREYQKILSNDYEVYTAQTVAAGKQLLRKYKPEVLLLDISLNREREGLEVLPAIKNEYPALAIVMVTNRDSYTISTAALDQGADYYFVKSESLDRLKLILLDIFSRKASESNDITENNIIAESGAMKNILLQLKKISYTDLPILLTGETGVGKEVLARYIHEQSMRKDCVFQAVNCGAIPETLLESELFGHVKGAFTGAAQSSRGKIESADKGTLFLDEIQDLSPRGQVALLRVLEQKNLERLGSSKMLEVDVRIIAATQTAPEKLIKNGSFREDLYFRLNVFHIQIPPLREREDDIMPLANYFLKQAIDENNLHHKQFTQSAQMLLKTYDWPGNVRELKHVVTRAAVMAPRREIRQSDFLLPIFDESQNNMSYDSARQQVIENFQRTFIKSALKRNNGNISATAKEIDLSRQSLQKIIKGLGLRS